MNLFSLCRDRQCGTRSHPAGANPSGGGKEDGGFQGKAKAASEEGQARWEDVPSCRVLILPQQGADPGAVSRHVPAPATVPSACAAGKC